MYWNGVLKRLDIFAKGSWFIYLIGSILLSLSITTTKNISRREWLLLFGIIGFYGWMANIILFFIFDLMDSGDPSIGGIPDIFMFVIGPAATAILFLNRYNTPTKLIRVIFFSILSFLVEYILGRLGYLKLKGWRPVYSIPFYLLLFAIVLPWTLKIIRK
ncbi:hypothetical protein [Neobacillus sp. CF12]|uniref:hypothetical protein n=1 Tax=Neobacillus sp. CF12 TaxID=3055864 RepID=UPI0025A13974|nr:hypothetical protein [Neobacillus sp. CF12]MDM5326954.1 hypothetical protein [Neobacillus sp. CF12]